jgi:hypothetical protein
MGLTPPAKLGELSEMGGALLPEPEVYIVVYKLSWPEEKYTSLLELLKDSMDWMHYFPGMWIIIRRETLVDLAAMMRKRVIGNDWLLVLPARGPGNGIMPNEAWEWLNTRLPNLW